MPPADGLPTGGQGTLLRQIYWDCKCPTRNATVLSEPEGKPAHDTHLEEGDAH